MRLKDQVDLEARSVARVYKLDRNIVFQQIMMLMAHDAMALPDAVEATEKHFREQASKGLRTTRRHLGDSK